MKTRMLFIGIALCLSMASSAMTSYPELDKDVGKNELVADYSVDTFSFSYDYTIVEHPSINYCEVEVVCTSANVIDVDSSVAPGLFVTNDAKYVVPPAWYGYGYSYNYNSHSTLTKTDNLSGNFDTAISRGGTGLHDTTFELKA